MATSDSQIQYIADQLTNLGSIRYKKMFGEYGVYCDEIFFAVVCNDMLFVKTSPSGKNSKNASLPDEVLSKLDRTIFAYPGSKNLAHVPDEIVEEAISLIPICKEVLKVLA